MIILSTFTMISGYKLTLMLSALMIVFYVQHRYQVTAAGESCGVPAIPPLTEQPNVIGGFQARPHSWPWQCLIQIEYAVMCGCSVLTSEWVVSAAHCWFEVGKQHAVLLGAHNISLLAHSSGPGADNISFLSVMTPFQAEKIVRHPQYITDTKDSDILLIKLTKPINFTDNISPVCLPTEDIPDGSKCIVAGWGMIKSNDTSFAVDSERVSLRQAMIPIVSNAQCQEWYKDSGGITDNQLCAGYDEVGACAGDSGSPLVCQTASGGVWTLYGIVSTGHGYCTAPHYPGIYTRVAKFLNWINSTIGNVLVAPKSPVIGMQSTETETETKTQPGTTGPANDTTPPVTYSTNSTTLMNRSTAVTPTNMSKMLHASMYNVGLCLCVFYAF